MKTIECKLKVTKYETKECIVNSIAEILPK